MRKVKNNPLFRPVSLRMEEALQQATAASSLIFGCNTVDGLPRLRVPVELERESDSDMLVIDGYLYLQESNVEEEVNTLRGKRKVMREGWYMSYGYEDPGVRYYPDGSGQPPSWEVQDCDPPEVTNLYGAISQLFGMVMQRVIKNMAEEAAYAKMVEAEERMYDEEAANTENRGRQPEGSLRVGLKQLGRGDA